ncbi:hypothetical protein NONI108955_06330 [Nocardia ninae]|uniref:Cation/H+ exchanger domain-containing protein n=1 Tax=Nocardia ninae NBRC 108245 TaxID=1210091 RepID=A0A511MJW0_9NOCA|nr:hypothetical protein [Nocardia ninae]GEM40914.1 hypothetical protein NN4_54330 [Nocardia ninae NBRC 108245]
MTKQTVRLLLLLGVTLAGYSLARILNWEHADSNPVYGVSVLVLLAIGLYGSTYGIDLAKAREEIRLILAVVTVGVLLKSALIGATIWLLTADIRYLALGVVVAQIDPLSVASILDDPRLSPRAKTILAAWASFDDPMTVILALFITPIVAQAAGVEVVDGAGSSWYGASGYILTTLTNIVFAGAGLLLWKFAAARPETIRTSLLAVLGAVAVWGRWMLGFALIGLFYRPDIGRFIPAAVNLALMLSAFASGLILVDGVSIMHGVLLGIAAFGSQVLIGWLLTIRLNRQDQLHLSFAQQNGITAIILGLLIEQQFPGTVAVVVPAIFTVNVLHLLSNSVIDRRTAPL